MSTWHQRQHPAKLWHDTMWTLVSDPPERCMTLMLFSNEADARARMKKEDHAYILRPENFYNKKKEG